MADIDKIEQELEKARNAVYTAKDKLVSIFPTAEQVFIGKRSDQANHEKDSLARHVKLIPILGNIIFWMCGESVVEKCLNQDRDNNPKLKQSLLSVKLQGRTEIAGELLGAAGFTTLCLLYFAPQAFGLAQAPQGVISAAQHLGIDKAGALGSVGSVFALIGLGLAVMKAAQMTASAIKGATVDPLLAEKGKGLEAFLSGILTSITPEVCRTSVQKGVKEFVGSAAAGDATVESSQSSSFDSDWSVLSENHREDSLADDDAEVTAELERDRAVSLSKT